MTPQTVLGMTGRTGAAALHLHIQARDKHNNPVLPDQAFLIGQKRPAATMNPEEEAGADFDPDLFLGVEPKVSGRVVRPKVEPESKWVVEVIGGGGRVQLNLGEFPTYRDASYCSLRWSEDHLDDLRLTREREVKLSGKSGRPE